MVLAMSKEWLAHAERMRVFDRAKEWERRYMLGEVVPGSRRIIGSREHDRIIAEREARAASMGNRGRVLRIQER